MSTMKKTHANLLEDQVILTFLMGKELFWSVRVVDASILKRLRNRDI